MHNSVFSSTELISSGYLTSKKLNNELDVDLKQSSKLTSKLFEVSLNLGTNLSRRFFIST